MFYANNALIINGFDFFVFAEVKNKITILKKNYFHSKV